MRLVGVDDRGDLAALVRRAHLSDRFEVVGAAANGDEAITLTLRCDPDAVMIRHDLTDLTGTDLINELQAAAPAISVIVVSGVSRAATAGRAATGSVSAAHDTATLIQTLDAAVSNGVPVTLKLTVDAEAVGLARRFLRDRCRHWGCNKFTAETAELIVSELVTNAVIHARTPSVLGLRLDTGVLRLEVTDHATGAPNPRNAEPYAEGGRGLRIVSTLANAWGVEPRPGGKLVWAELAP